MLLGLVLFPLCFISTNPDSCMLPGVSFALAGSMRVAWLPNAVRSFSALGGPFWARISLDIWRVRALECENLECFRQHGKQCSHDRSASHCFPHINADNVRGADEHIFASGRSSPLFGKHRVWTAIFVPCHSKHATKHKPPYGTRS